MTSCALLSPGIPLASDSFCSTYQPLQGVAGVGSIATTREIKNRISANEKTYLCLCPGGNPKHPVCKGSS